jgi:hypothetical protein
MPLTTQALYFHLSMRAKDKGILNNAKSICKEIGVEIKDLLQLRESGFIKQIDSEIIEIVHWDINNGIAETAHKRISYKYRKWRDSVLQRDNYTCQECSYKGKNLNVHHIKHFSDHEELRYDIGNAVTLCELCHRKLHKEERENV